MKALKTEPIACSLAGRPHKRSEWVVEYWAAWLKHADWLIAHRPWALVGYYPRGYTTPALDSERDTYKLLASLLLIVPVYHTLKWTAGESGSYRC